MFFSRKNVGLQLSIFPGNFGPVFGLVFTNKNWGNEKIREGKNHPSKKLMQLKRRLNKIDWSLYSHQLACNLLNENNEKTCIVYLVI